VAVVGEFTTVVFWLDDVNPFGPLQLYVAPAMATWLRFSVWFKQIGELLLMVGVAAAGLIVTLVIEGGLVHPRIVCVTE
jgi:hypothetical protein